MNMAVTEEGLTVVRSDRGVQERQEKQLSF
jgi:hypothetical protein